MGKKRRYLKKENKKKQNRDVLGKKSEIVPYRYEIPKVNQENIDLHRRIQEESRLMQELGKKIQDQWKPMQEFWKSTQVQWETIQQAWSKKIQDQWKPMQGLSKRIIQEHLKPMQELSKRIEEQYLPLFEQINIYKNINWEVWNQAAAEELKQIDRVLSEHEKEYWCLDMNIATSLVNGNIKEENLSKCVEENLESYVAEIIRNPMYEIHVTLIEEAYEAYKLGLYICIMPLFAAFEHVITFWFKGNITKEMISIKSNPNLRRIYKKIKPEEYRELEIEKIKHVFASSVLTTFHNMFLTPEGELLGTNLNRNSIAHGFHDYNTLSKIDALKLFQLLKSSLILQFVTPKKVAES
ncbi:hypothetical protein ACK3XG_22450 [Bacillus sp. TD10]|uniref:hypothetical protein n=1 Tax=Bacillus sp. TD10 TaxID=1672662 RepID=UPI00391D378C